jgi:hypothetical protein
MNAIIYQEHKLREPHHVRAESQTHAPDKRAHWGRLERCALKGTETDTNAAAARLAAAQRDSWLPRRRQLQGRVRRGTQIPDRVLRDHHRERRRREGAHPERLDEPPQNSEVPPLPLLHAGLTMLGRWRCLALPRRADCGAAPRPTLGEQPASGPRPPLAALRLTATLNFECPRAATLSEGEDWAA